MKKLRILLLYKIIIIFFFFTLCYVFINIKLEKIIEYQDITLTGTITNIKEKDTYSILEIKSKKNILVYSKNDEKYNLGEKIKITGDLKIPSNNTIFNLFNYRKYLKSKKINYTMTPTKIEKIDSTKDIRYKIKIKIKKYINSFKSEKYLKTFILGDNSDIDDEISTSYQLNGISHLFAISGMHLSLFSSTFFVILKKLKLKDTSIYITIILFFSFFCFLTNYTPSILRAYFMYILIFLNKKLKLKIKNTYILLIVIEIMLLYNPFYIFNNGFLFSSIITMFLILFSEIISNKKIYIHKIFTTSLISQLASLPIQINSFFQINILASIFNVIFVPFISFVIFPLALLTLIIKPLDEFFFEILKYLEILSLKLSKISININLSHIPWYTIIIYYIAIIIFIIGIKKTKILYFFPLVVIIFIHSNIAKINLNNAFFILDVGQGDSSLLRINKKNILIDTGGIVNKDITISKTIPFFKSLGIDKLDYLIISHGDYDHMGGAINLVENFKVEKVIFNCGEFNDLEKELIKVLDKKKISYYSCIKELNMDNNKLYFLQTKEYDNENDNSNVIYTEINGYKFMFMGDAGIEKEKDIIDKYSINNIDVLKVGHHGSKTSSSESFINEMNPKYGVISVGKNNRYGHPNKEVLNNLDASKIYRTDQDGSIMFKIKNNKLEIETCAP